MLIGALEQVAQLRISKASRYIIELGTFGPDFPRAGHELSCLQLSELTIKLGMRWHCDAFCDACSTITPPKCEFDDYPRS